MTKKTLMLGGLKSPTTLFVLMALMMWASFWTPIVMWTDIPIVTVVGTSGSIIVALGGVVYSPKPNFFGMVITLLTVLSIIISAFASLYFRYGTAHNFGGNLTRVDALYFALGIFSTAGTGPFAANTEIARSLVTLQFAVDLPVTFILVALVVSRVGQAMA